MTVPQQRSARVVDARRFRHSFRQVPAAVAVVLTREDGGAVRGLTCTSATSLSAEPPMALVSLDDRTGMAQLVEAHGWFSLNFLDARRADLARAFAGRGTDLTHLTSVIVSGRTGIPVLGTGTTTVLECAVDKVVRGGDHWVVHGIARHARFQSDAEPLLYGGGRFGGFTPRPA